MSGRTFGSVRSNELRRGKLFASAWLFKMSSKPRRTRNPKPVEVEDEVDTEQNSTTNSDELLQRLLQEVNALKARLDPKSIDSNESSEEDDDLDLEPPISKKRKLRENSERRVYTHVNPDILEDLPPLQLVIVTAEEVEKERNSAIVFGDRPDKDQFSASKTIRKREDRPFYQKTDKLHSWKDIQQLAREAYTRFKSSQITPLRVAYYLAEELKSTPFAPFLTSKDGYEILQNMRSEEKFKTLLSRSDRRILVEDLATCKNSEADLFKTLASADIEDPHRNEHFALAMVALVRAASADESLNKAATLAFPNILRLLTTKNNPKEVGNAAMLFHAMWSLCGDKKQFVTPSTPSLFPTTVVRNVDRHSGAGSSNQNVNRRKKNHEKRGNDGNPIQASPQVDASPQRGPKNDRGPNSGPFKKNNDKMKQKNPGN